MSVLCHIDDWNAVGGWHQLAAFTLDAKFQETPVLPLHLSLGCMSGRPCPLGAQEFDVRMEAPHLIEFAVAAHLQNAGTNQL